jgi:hypothetical protein
MLSCIEPLTLPVNHDALATAQHSDDKLRTPLMWNTALQLEKLLITGTSVELYCDTSAENPGP